MPLTSARLPGERGEHPSSPAARLPAQASLPPLHGLPTRGLGPHSRVAAVPRACARNSWLLQRLEVAARGGFRQAAASSPGEGTALLRPSRWPRPRALLLLGSECPRQTGDVGSVRRTASWERNVPVLSGHTGRRPPYRAVPTGSISTTAEHAAGQAVSGLWARSPASQVPRAGCKALRGISLDPCKPASALARCPAPQCPLQRGTGSTHQSPRTKPLCPQPR